MLDRRTALQQLAAGGIGIFACCCGCKSAPMTGRRQLMLMPEHQEVQLGGEAFAEVLATEQPTTNPAWQAMVSRVGQQIANVSGRTDYQWEFHVIASPTQNAFCLPGGKVAVYEGILPICQNEAGLAVVMSHEVAHALARHGGERMSQSMAVGGAREVVDRVLQSKVPDRRQQLLQAYGLASQYGIILPYSRKQESEADHIGIMLMAQAGYDPSEGPRFWQRFATMDPNSKPPEFMSTHPADSRRVADLQALMVEADGLYRQSPRQWGLGESISI